MKITTGRLVAAAICLGAGGVALQQGWINGAMAASAPKEVQADVPPEQLARVEDISATFRTVSKAVKPAVVTIKTTSTVKASARRPRLPLDELPEQFRDFFREPGIPEQLEPQRSSGSGVIIDAERGYILTNNHVIGGDEDTEKSRIYVHLADGRRYQGKVLGTDPKTDLALIQIKAERLTAAKLGDSDKIEVGDWVLAIGAPFGLDQTVTQGIISATGRTTEITPIGEFIQTDAAINPGNSGGPLVNMRGEVIGINTAIATTGMAAGYMGVGFAIPSNLAKEILPALEKGEEVVRGYLGVQIRGLDTFEPGIGKSFGLSEDRGVLIEDVMPDTPAAKAGLKADDVILSYDGKEVTSAPELQKLVTRTAPNTKVNLRVWRDRKEITIPVTIEKQPSDFYSRNRTRGIGPGSGRGEEESTEVTIESLGMTIAPMSEALAKRFKWPEDEAKTQGVVVTSVEPLGEARAAGLTPGDMIISIQSQPVRSVRQVQEALSKEALASGVRLRVRNPSGLQRTIFLQIEP